MAHTRSREEEEGTQNVNLREQPAVAAGFVYSSSPEATDVDPPKERLQISQVTSLRICSSLYQRESPARVHKASKDDCLSPHLRPSVITPPSVLMRGKQTRRG